MKIRQILFTSVLMLISTVLIAQNSPILKGVGFSRAFEYGSSVYDIQFNQYSKQDFLNVKKLGINQVRLPIFIDNMVQPNGEFYPLFFYLLDQYVDMAEEVGLNIVLTDMTAYDYSDTENLRSLLLNQWPQLAEHYKDRSDLIIYEIATEPNNISDEDWGSIQGEAIEAIRAIDTVHTIVVTGAGHGNLYALDKLPEYADTNLIYSFHFYDPFLFTHQGSEPADLGELKGVPFPYDASRMPPMPSSFVGTYNEVMYNDYPSGATVERIREMIEVAADFKNERNVHVWCGEWGADRFYSNINDRALWYETMRTVMEENGISWSMHGYTEYTGLFEYPTYELFDYDLSIPVVEAMGLNVQPQSELEIKPDTTSIVIYDDYVSRDIKLWISIEDSLSHVYSQNNPKNGKFCIQMKDFPIWCNFNFAFEPERDLTKLVEEGYCLSFWIRGDTPGAKFNVRFFDTDTDDPEDRPWRMVHDIDENLAPWDNEWHYVQIPLKNFSPQGTWDDDAWHEPEGKFDWSAIDVFEIQTEFEGLEGKQFWFDDIQISPAIVKDSVNITFRVDMQNEDVSSKGVLLSGNFNNWNSNDTLQNEGSVYYKTIKLESGTQIEYKFLNGDTWETSLPNTCATIDDNNRYFLVPETDTILTAVCFNSCDACVATSIEESKYAGIHVFPNPTKGTIEITDLPLNKKMEIGIYGLNSQLIKKISINNQSSVKIDLSDVIAGIYFINIKGDDLNEAIKIVKTDR